MPSFVVCSLSPLSSGPLVHYWYEILNKVMVSLGYNSKAQQQLPVVLGKVALDQLVFSPPFNLLYFHAIGAMEGTAASVVQEKIARDFMPLMIANWKVRPAPPHSAERATSEPPQTRSALLRTGDESLQKPSRDSYSFRPGHNLLWLRAVLLCGCCCCCCVALRCGL